MNTILALILITLAAATSGEAAECLSRAELERLRTLADCPRIADAHAPSGLVRDCHTQGIGQDPSGSTVVTCMDRGFGGKGRVFLYAPGAIESSVPPVFDFEHPSGKLKHPSAFQFNEAGVFPVAFSEDRSGGQTEIRFFSVASGPELRTEATLEYGDHLGALGFAAIGGRAYLLGCNWNCRKLAIWSAEAADRGAGFRFELVRPFRSLIDPSGIDSKPGDYNSLHLATRCEDGKPILFATDEERLDLWEIEGLPASPRLKKIRTLVVGAPEQVFHEGMSLRTREGRIELLANPLDFERRSSSAGARTAPLHRCSF